MQPKVDYPIQTDGCTSPVCVQQFNATSSLSQGQEFARMTRSYHGGRRIRSYRSHRSHRRQRGGVAEADRSYLDTIQSSFLPPNEMVRKANYNVKGGRRFRMRGGALADYPTSFDSVLPQDMRAAADIGKLDSAFGQLPQFAGKYGMNGGARRTRRNRSNHMQRGGMADIKAPSMILTPQEEPAAFLNPQWYTENQVVPSFVGPNNSYVQKGARRSRKASRKNRKASRKNRKASRKNRK